MLTRLPLYVIMLILGLLCFCFFSCQPAERTLAAEMPIFSIPAGTYFTGQFVTISAPVAETLIRYTIDGSIPTEYYGEQYNGVPLYITRSITLKAVAYSTVHLPSGVNTIEYVISTQENPTIKASAPVFTPGAGTYQGTQIVTISTATSGASIRYTTDGSVPSNEYGVEYTGVPITITNTSIMKAIAFMEGYLNSDITTAGFEIAGTVANPGYSPPAGTYTTGQSVTIFCSTTGAEIWYTVDGTNPSPDNGNLYTGPIAVPATITIRAIAFKEGLKESNVVQAAYTIGATCAKPVYNYAQGTYAESLLVTITTTTPGAFVRYTLDGTAPTDVYGTIYTVPVLVSRTRTLKAVSYKAGFITSQQQSAVYTIAIDSANATGFNTSAGVSGSNVCILHKDDTNDNLRFAKSPDNGTNWSTGAIDEPGDVGLYSSMKMDGTNIYAAYYDNTNKDLIFTRSPDNGATWYRYKADTAGDTGMYTAIDVDAGGNVYISYYDNTGKDLEFARTADGGNTWTRVSVDTTGDVGKYSSILVDGTNVVIAYYDVTNTDLKAATSVDAGDTWTPAVVDNTAGRDVGMNACIEKDSAGSLYVIYYDNTEYNIKLAVYSGSWNTGTVLPDCDVGSYLGLYIGADDALNIVYHNETFFNVEFIRSTDGGSSWSTPVVIDEYYVGRYCSIAGSGGTLWVAYQEFVNSDLKAAVSTNNGNNWSIY